MAKKLKVGDEINGYRIADGTPLSGFAELKADGSTVGGCWIYAGVYKDGVNQAARRKPRTEQDFVAREWGWVWVNVPSFSTCEAAGTKKTSVLHCSGTISPVATSGESFQNVALSIRNRSRTTSQSRLAMPSRCARPFAEPTAGF